MQSKTLRIIIGSLLALVLIAGSYSGGVITGWLFPIRGLSASHAPAYEIQSPTQAGPVSPTPFPTATPSSAGDTATPGELQQLFQPFWQAWQIVHDQYVDQPIDDEAIMRGAIQGMLEALGDQHTSYMSPEEYLQATLSMEGGYEGIGAWVDSTGEYLTIISPMPGSPAEEAGLKPGDQILAVDGKDMTGMDGQVVITYVIGPAGSTVLLTILREGATEPFDVPVTRGKITVPSLASEMLDGKIAYIQFFTFGETSGDELHQALEEIMAQKPTGIIFDLRNNGGGYLSTSIQVASEFIDQGVLLYEEYGNGREQTYEAQPGGLAIDIPLVVLVNEGTASASEIVAGAIQDTGRGKLVGAVTYGKGSVQNWLELDNQEGAVRVTIARWLTPDRHQIHEIGLKPDVEVQLTEEDLQAGKDPQLEKAIEVLAGITR
ncbi:MAG: S41 family peptidase [Chloroflexi bacterium]|nr:S41 family peptidase [Chloroflexota bacterium]